MFSLIRLFIGISLLSIVEILELILELMFYFLSFKKKSKIRMRIDLLKAFNNNNNNNEKNLKH
jgi:hypothetical protein